VASACKCDRKCAAVFVECFDHGQDEARQESTITSKRSVGNDDERRMVYLGERREEGGGRRDEAR
jgi:hypothetical protein